MLMVEMTQVRRRIPQMDARQAAYTCAGVVAPLMMAIALTAFPSSSAPLATFQFKGTH